MRTKRRIKNSRMKKTHLILVGLLLSFTLNATNDIPRPEYPRPQFERPEWINLNGEWTYEFDFSNSGKSRRLTKVEAFDIRNYIIFIQGRFL